MYDFDDDVPAGYTDADLLQAEFEAEGDRLAAIERTGVCTHSGTQGYSERCRPDLNPGQVACLDCGVMFASEDDYLDAREEVLAR
jgi:hypothetical protein